MRLVKNIAEHIAFCLLLYSKYSLRKALVKAHAFYGHVSLETLGYFKKRGTFDSCVSSRSERFQISSLKIVHFLL